MSTADTLLACIRDLSHLPASQQPGDWAELATAVNALDDLLSMGGEPPAAWSRETWKPYAPREAPVGDRQLPIPGLVFGQKEAESA